MTIPTLKLKTLALGTGLLLGSWLLFMILFIVPEAHGFYETLESWLYYQIFTSTATPSEHLLIIDEEDHEYDRVTYAQLISGLDRLGAKVIVMDVLFASAKEAPQDAQLIEATHRASDKIIHAVEFVGFNNHAIIPERFHFKTSELPTAEDFAQNIQGATLPFDGLLETTTHLGHVTGGADIAYREELYFPMLIRYNDKLYPALSLLAVMKFLDCPTDSMPRLRDDTIELTGNGSSLKIPLAAQSKALINFIPPENFSGKLLSVEEALKHIRENNEVFKDKIVLIGNSRDSQEQTHGPHFQSYPNLIIHASLISQMLHNENIREGIFESLFAGLLLLLAGFAWLFFFAPKFDRIKPWQIVLAAFVLLLLAATMALHFRMRLYVILPFVGDSLAYAFAKRFYGKELFRPLGSKQRLAYRDYYVLIGPKRKETNAYPLFLLDSPAGEDFGELQIPLSETEINSVRECMARNEKLEASLLKDFGAALFKALFQPSIRDQYDKSMGVAHAQDTCLRLKLRIDAPDLACYPWEYMYDNEQAKDFLALHQKISITRFLAIQEVVPSITLKPPLKILVVIPSPTDKLYAELAVEEEKRIMQAALAPLAKRGIAQLHFLKAATLESFAKALRNKVDVIHFIGHGGFSETGGGCLVFENQFRESELVSVDRLGKLLEGKAIRLVVLNACQTAQTSASDISMGVAQGLVKIGIPAVLAMQFKILDESAVAFSKEFYTTLAETFQVDRAVSEARRKMFIHLDSGRIDWGIPVLFMRKDDGVIF